MSEPMRTHDEVQSIVDDVTDMRMVEKAHINDNGSIYVAFNVDKVPESFTDEMLSRGYVSAQVSESAMSGVSIGIVFKNAIGF